MVKFLKVAGLTKVNIGIGPSLEWVYKLYDYWLNKYSWADAQRAISQWHHFTTEIEGLTVHFIHEKARVCQKKAVPLLLVHGWPGTFHECVKAKGGNYNE